MDMERREAKKIIRGKSLEGDICEAKIEMKV
jgi:hypothetical protein